MIYFNKKYQSVLLGTSLLLSLINTGQCATTSQVNIGASSSSLLKKASHDVKTYGDLIYKGTVFKLDAKASGHLYVYERRVRSAGDQQFSTSFTHDEHNVALIQMATHDSGFRLKDYTEYQYQLGEVGSVTMTGTTAEFSLVNGEIEKKAREKVSLPVVVGPTLYGFVYQNWEKLLAGDSVDLRFAVISRLETVGFILQKVPSSDNLVRIRMKAGSPLIALLVDPIYFTFSADRRLVSLEGRIPTKLKVGNNWADLDAYITYENAEINFR